MPLVAPPSSEPHANCETDAERGDHGKADHSRDHGRLPKLEGAACFRTAKTVPLLTMCFLWRGDLEGGAFQVPDFIGAGEAIRTPDPNLGKVMLYP
jgi:hypothetical protein